MGRRPGDPQGAGPGLVADQPLDVLEAGADLVGQQLQRRRADVAALGAVAGDHLEPGARRCKQRRRAPVEAALLGFAGLGPVAGDRVHVEVGRRPAAEIVDQAQRVVQAGEADDRLRGGFGAACGSGCGTRLSILPLVAREG